MNKSEFLEQLGKHIAVLPTEEIEKTLSYYEEMIDDRIEDGCDENRAIEALGTPEQVAHSVLLACPLPTLMLSRMEQSHRESSHRGLWLALIIVGSPIWFSLLIAAASVVFAVYVTLWSLMIALYAILVSFAISGVATTLFGIPLCFIRGVPIGLCMSGCGLILFGGALLLYRPTVYLTRALLRLTVKFAAWIKSLFIKKQEVNAL